MNIERAATLIQGKVRTRNRIDKLYSSFFDYKETCTRKLYWYAGNAIFNKEREINTKLFPLMAKYLFEHHFKKHRPGKPIILPIQWTKHYVGFNANQN